jgi:hypothetical protein
VVTVRPSDGVIASIVLLAAWLGAALLLAAVVAPAAFTLPSRTLAGALVGRVLPSIFWSGMAIGLIVAVVGIQRPAAMWRTAAAMTMVAACAAAQLVVAPRIARLRDAIGGPIDALDPADPRRAAFGRLHALSVAWMGLGGLAALIALILLLRVLSTRSTS